MDFLVFLLLIAGAVFSLLATFERYYKEEEIERQEKEWVSYMQEYAMSDDEEINRVEAEKAVCFFLKQIGHEDIAEQFKESVNHADEF